MLDSILLYNNPSTLYGVGIACVFIFLYRLATITGDDYTERAEQYWINQSRDQ